VQLPLVCGTVWTEPSVKALSFNKKIALRKNRTQIMGLHLTYEMQWVIVSKWFIFFLHQPRRNLKHYKYKRR